MAVQYKVAGCSKLHLRFILSAWILSCLQCVAYAPKQEARETCTSAAPELTGCQYSVDYVASPLEVFWRGFSKKLSHPEFVSGKNTGPKWASPAQQEEACALMKKQEPNITHWLEVWEARQEAATSSFDKSIFSYQILKSICKREGTEVVSRTIETPVEPLFGYLAHPLFKCLRDVKTHRARTEYMLPFWNKEIMPSTKETEEPISNYFFDLGGSVYDAGPASYSGGGSLYSRDDEDALLREVSQKWFIEDYASKGITFDRILVWEMEIHAPKDIFDAMPDEVFDRTSYYNMPVSGDRYSKFSPLRTLKSLVKPEDFVVFKIDIDHPETEQAIIQTILDSGREFCDLIDELYFEHHVWSPKMQVFEDFWSQQNITMSLHDSFELFAKLRECGIRAHSWI